MGPERSTVDPLDDVVIATSVDLPVAVADAFGLFASAAAVESWLCRRAVVESRVGGRYELFWDLDDPLHDSTIGCRVTALDAPGLLAFQWRSPRQFKSFANGADPLTHVVVAFRDVAGGTRVSLVHSGWRSSPEWRAACDWQRAAWGHAFQALVARVPRR